MEQRASRGNKVTLEDAIKKFGFRKENVLAIKQLVLAQGSARGTKLGDLIEGQLKKDQKAGEKILRQTFKRLGDKASMEPLSYWDTAQRILKINAGKQVSPRFIELNSISSDAIPTTGYEKKQREIKLIYSVKNKPEFIQRQQNPAKKKERPNITKSPERGIK